MPATFRLASNIHIAPSRAGSTEIPLRFEEFAIQDGGASGATDGVMRQDSESPVEQVAGAQPPDNCGHSRAAVNVQPRLRAIGSRIIDDRLLWCAWQFELLGR